MLTGKKCRPFKVNATTTIGITYESKWFKSRYYLPLEKGTTIHLNKRTLPSSKTALCQVWLKYGTMVLEMMIFIRRQGILAISNYFPLEKGTVLYLKFVPSLIENWLSGSRSGEEFQMSLYFRYFAIIFPWKKSTALHVNNIELPSPTGGLCNDWLKFTQPFCIVANHVQNVRSSPIGGSQQYVSGLLTVARDDGRFGEVDF